MKSISETGHAINLANFQRLVTFVESYGIQYNPSKEALKLPQLQQQMTEARAKLNVVLDQKTNFSEAVNNRIIAFKNLRKYATRLINALQVTDATPEKVANARSYISKLSGKTLAKPSVLSQNPEEAHKTISTSQQSYNQLIQHFAGLISVIQSETSYQPNEEDLTKEALTQKKEQLLSLNNQVALAYTNVSNARIDRNTILYLPSTGLVEIALEVKKYVKSVFGSESPQFKQIQTIPFRTVPN